MLRHTHDETGVLRTAPVNGARHGYKYDGRKWVETGLILEAAATNRKQNFISSAGALQWSTNQNSEPVANYTVKSPDDSYGTIRQKINSTANAIHSIYDHTSVTATSQLCFSVYAKAAEYNRIYMYTDGTAPTIGGVTYDLLNGTIAGTDGLTRDAYGIEDVGNGWYRCWYSGTTTSGTTAYWHIDIAQSDSTRTFVGTVGQGLYLWGPQMEYSGALSSYIYTDTSAVTRSADVSSSVAYTREEDVAYIDDIQNSDWYDGADSGATIYAEGRTVFDTGLTDECVFVDFHSGSSTDEIRLYHRASTSTINFINDGGSDVILNSGIHGGNNYHKMAGAMALNDFAFSVDGGTTLSDVSNGPSLDTLTTMGIGGGYTSAITLSGHIKKISYYPERFTNAELQALTENN